MDPVLAGERISAWNYDCEERGTVHAVRVDLLCKSLQIPGAIVNPGFEILTILDVIY